MSTTTDPVGPEELRISVEMGAECVTSPRLSNAINELAAALQAEDDDDVQGFGAQEFEVNFRNFSFMGPPKTAEWLSPCKVGKVYNCKIVSDPKN